MLIDDSTILYNDDFALESINYNLFDGDFGVSTLDSGFIGVLESPKGPQFETSQTLGGGVDSDASVSEVPPHSTPTPFSIMSSFVAASKAMPPLGNLERPSTSTYQVRLDEERSDETTTHSQAKKIAHARTSV